MSRIKRKLIWSLILLFVISLVWPAAAEADSEGIPKPKVKEVDLDENKINLEGVGLKEAFRTLANVAKINIIIDNRIEGTVTAYLEDVSVQEAIKMLVNIHGLGYKKKNDTIIIGPKQKLKAGFTDKSKLKNRVRTKNEKINFQEDKITLKGAELKTVFRTLADSAGINIMIDEQIKGTVSAALNNVPPRQVIKMLVNSNGLGYKEIDNTIIIGPKEELKVGFEDKVTRVFNLENAKPKKLKEDLGILIKNKEIKVNERKNSLLVSSYKDKLPAVEKAVQSLDKPRNQVIIQTHLIEISRSKLKEAGVNWSEVSNITYNPEADGSKFNFGTINLNYENVLELLSKDEKDLVSTLANPKLKTLDGEKATINIGEEVPIVQEKDDNIKVNFRNVGISLEIKPRVNGDNKVQIDVNPEVSVVKELIKAGDSVYPRIGTRTAETKVQVKDGETVAIGGLIQEEKNSTVTKVPWLGDIPILGLPFKRKSKDTEEKELVIFLTPNIVKRDKEADKLKENMKLFKYEVKKGETVWEISNLFNVSFSSIIDNNEVDLIRNLKPGRSINIPVPKNRYYHVKKNDTISKIANKYILKPDDIKRINQIKSLEDKIGAEIVLPMKVKPEDRSK